MPAIPASLTRFRTAYSALLAAAEAVRCEMERLAQQLPAAPPNVRAIQSLVADHYGLPLELLLGRRRDHRTALARQVAMRLCSELTPFKLVAVGQMFSRDHGTVIYNRTSLTERLETDAAFRAEYDRLRELARRAVVNARRAEAPPQ